MGTVVRAFELSEVWWCRQNTLHTGGLDSSCTSFVRNALPVDLIESLADPVDRRLAPVLDSSGGRLRRRRDAVDIEGIARRRHRVRRRRLGMVGNDTREYDTFRQHYVMLNVGTCTGWV